MIPLPRIWLYPGRQRQLSGSQHSRKAFYIVYLLGFIPASVPPSDLSSMFNSLPLSRELLIGSALPLLLVLTTFSTLQRALRQYLPACRMARAPSGQILRQDLKLALSLLLLGLGCVFIF